MTDSDDIVSSSENQFIVMLYLSELNQCCEEEIIENLKSSGVNKTRAENQLFKRFSYFISIGANRYTLSSDDSFNAYADTVLAVIHSITAGNFKNRSSLKTFMHEIFHNKCIDEIRKKSTRKNTVHKTESISDLHGYLTDTSVSVIEKLVKQSDMERIQQKMSYLSKRYQKILLLSADGYSDKEIAVIAKFKTADVVKTCRLRCIKKLRQLVS